MSVEVHFLIPGSSPATVHATTNNSILDAWSLAIGPHHAKPDAYILCNGKPTSLESKVQDGQRYHVMPRVLGGKGGFGSMLRAIGAQIEKTTNREACRDISGRRMRDVNNEQKLRDWVAKAAERERERDQKKQERRERRKAEPKHVFDDPEYTKQTSKVKEGLEDALQKGLQKMSSSKSSTKTTTSLKRKGSKDTSSASSTKKAALDSDWVGLDLDSDVDLDSSDDSDSDMEAAALVSRAGSSQHANIASGSVNEEEPGPSCSRVDSDPTPGSSSVSDDILRPSTTVSSDSDPSESATPSPESGSECAAEHNSNQMSSAESSDDTTQEQTSENEVAVPLKSALTT